MALHTCARQVCVTPVLATMHQLSCFSACCWMSPAYFSTAAMSDSTLLASWSHVARSTIWASLKTTVSHYWVSHLRPWASLHQSQQQPKDFTSAACLSSVTCHISWLFTEGSTYDVNSAGWACLSYLPRAALKMLTRARSAGGTDSNIRVRLSLSQCLARNLS